MGIATKFASYHTAITTGYTDPTQGYTDDGLYATAAPAAKNTEISAYWGFAAFSTSDIPNGATINSVKIEHEFKVSTDKSIASEFHQIFLNTTGVNAEQADATEPTTDKIVSHTVTTGISLADLRTADYVRLRTRSLRGNSATAVTFSIDYVKITVTYTPLPPTNLASPSQTETTIDLTWTKGVNSDKTLIRFKTGAYPTSKTDGTQTYFDTGESVTVADLNKIAESIAYGNPISDLVFDGTYIYAASGTTNKVWKINPATMSTVGESANYGGNIYALAFDGTYIYAAGDTTQKVWKINPADMSKVGESINYGGIIKALAFDGTYIYAAGSTTQKVWKINPADMSKVGESINYGGQIFALTSDGTYIYAGGLDTNKVWKINPADMSKVGESANYGGYIYVLAFYDTYIYVGGSTQKVWKINPADMSKVGESIAYGGQICALTSDGTYIYAGGDTTNKVWKINPADMSKVGESANYGGIIFALAFDGTNIYAAGDGTQKVWKLMVYVLEPATTYYFRAWGYDSSTGLYSTTTADLTQATAGGVPPGWNKILYTSEPPTPNAWNQLKQEAGTGWRKLLYT